MFARGSAPGAMVPPFPWSVFCFPGRGLRPSLLTATDNNRYDVRMAPRPVAAKARPAASPQVMTIDDLAEYLQLSKSSLYKLAQEEKVPGQKVGRHWRFHREAIDKWLKRGR